MPTCLVTVFNEQNRPIASFSCAVNGGYHDMGLDLQTALKETVISSRGVGPDISRNMGRLVCKLMRRLTSAINPTFCQNHETKDFNYEIRFIETSGDNNRVALTCRNQSAPTRTFQLYSDEILPFTILRRVTFVYDKQDGSFATWRTVDVTNEDGDSIHGLEDGKYKRFLLRKIVGGKVFAA